jgi:ADP-ribosyl-[dinitrogen reductase] hydrolase
MPRPSFDPAARARGAMLGALAGGGDAPLLGILAEELADGRTDLRRLAERWVERYRRDPRGFDPESAAALEFIATHHAPPTSGGSGAGALGRVMPVALVAYRSPRTLVSATYHIAALTHPAPDAAWGAVAVNVALGRLLQGHRDFVADVVEALAGNAAPETLVAAVRRVPLQRRDTLPLPVAAGDPAAAVELALGLAYHEPIAARGLDLVREAGTTPAGAAAGALLGARDGAAGIPERWLEGEAAVRWAALADRLARVAPAGAGTT